MQRVKVRRAAQITLPPEVQRKLGVAEGDYLDVELVDNGVLLKPSSEAHRRAALARIHKAQTGVRYIGPEPRPSPEEEDRLIAEMLEADKAEEAAGKRS